MEIASLLFQAREPGHSRADHGSAAANLVTLSVTKFRPIVVPALPLSFRIPSWPSEPAGPCTCRFSDRGGAGGVIRRNPCPRHKSASSARPPSGACHAATAMFFFCERPYQVL